MTTTTKAASDASLRKVLSDYAVAHGLDAEGMVRWAAQAGTRRLAQQNRTEVAAAADRLYDACFGPGASTRDSRPPTHRK